MPQILSRYDVRRELGRGGMGVVYEAHDARLDRTVAVKVLQADHGAPDRRQRFRQEARAASALNHPNIITVHDIDTAGDVDYIVMEYVEGTPLTTLIAKGPLEIQTAVRYAADIAGALAAAHAAGIVHRDLKPANIMVSAAGRIKVLDFGLSKIIVPADGAGQSTRTAAPATEPGIIAGTVGYMSPEQATGGTIGPPSDVFSFGIVLYEMLTGRRAFAGDSYWATLQAIVRDEVPPVQQVRGDTPVELSRIVARCLEKEPTKRYTSAIDVAADLGRLVSTPHVTVAAWIRTHRKTAAAAAGLLVLGVTAASVAVARWQSERTVQAGLREVQQRLDAARYGSAYSVARALQQKAPGDLRVQRALFDATVPLTVRTDPPGAELFFRDFGDTDGRWERFGTSPLINTRVPFGALRWKITKAGFDPVEARLLWWEGPPLRLHKSGTSPAGMVYVGSGRLAAASGLVEQEIREFWIDKYEVTNQQFKRFIDEGGYRDQRFWKYPFTKDGHTLTWQEGIALLRDKTGRSGPAAWELGTFPTGQADYPVAGVSWYEAAAFAEFAGKNLPTVAHWIRATGPPNLRDDISQGNFASSGPRAVNDLKDLGAFGTLGMSGNVKEWCVNPVEGQRYLLGGGWNEPIYMATNLDARPPFDRAETNGFRTVKYVVPPDSGTAAEVRSLPRHIRFPPPVSDEVFDAYRSIYAYDKSPLDARTEHVEESEYYRKETVSVAPAYGRERLVVHLLLPKNAVPPYQAVLYYPGGYAYSLPSSGELPVSIYFDFLVRSGRALVHPVYQGTYERRFSAAQPRGRARRDMIIDSAKDLSRTIDYLETRRDIDHERLGFYVFSTGGQILPAVTMEPRLKAAVFLSAGIGPRRAAVATPPEIDPINFAPRMKIPLLLLGGRYDFVLPVETSQKPLFALIGTRPADKRHFLFDAGHIPPRNLLIRETLDWLDRYLGAVRTK